MRYRLALRLSCRGRDFRLYTDVIFCYMKSNKLFAAEVPKDPDAAVADKRFDFAGYLRYNVCNA